eukprot:CAMPEP_0203749128 /NCGR_PEP_ID=MMETSP0098-20131031/3800_1 /ASSEMBLY_ACC=CAM_ASM_000208 /TAXON_ID=96639 /ORGANISM=" , Strain NY0313808BC1" /LENGTH=801 /DNA_ID=CAMNT_0050638095 /DNA_START=282 /DNA_END=2684 /DNA_ORIENTATION=+
MLSTSFKTQLNSKIQPGLVCFGKFEDGKASLAVATTGNRVLIHRPGNEEKEHRFLNINREISALSSGAINQATPDREMLLVGSPSSLLAYDVHNNSDLFYKDVQEGVNAVGFGKLSSVEKPLVFVGGNCSLQGFDGEGMERFWTVIGGNAQTLAFCDTDRSGETSLLVGSEDFEIRAFQSEQSCFEVTETESVTHLCAMDGDLPSQSRFGYGLGNGTIGIYDGQTRVWRMKAKDKVHAMISFDLDGDGVDEIITGWSNGKLEARRNEDGEVVYRENLCGPISSLLKVDFRNARENEKEQLVCCTLDGEIRGYAAANPDGEGSQYSALFSLGAVTGAVSNSIGFAGDQDGDESMRSGQASGQNDQVMRALIGVQHPEDDNEEPLPELISMDEDPTSSVVHEYRDSSMTKLQDEMTLKMMELQSLEENLQNAKNGKNRGPAGAIPKDTCLGIKMEVNVVERCLELIVETNNDTVIQNVLVFAFDGGIFKSECQIASPETMHSGTVRVKLQPMKNVPVQLKIQSFVSARGSSDYMHVLEHVYDLPQFALFGAPPRESIHIEHGEDIGTAAFTIADMSPDAVREALGRMFGAELVSVGIDEVKGPRFRLQALALNPDKAVPNARVILTVKEQMIEKRIDTKVQLQCDRLDLASQIVQSLATELDITYLEASADFPKEMRQLEGYMNDVQEYNSIRQKLGAEMADESHYIKTLIIKGEDARMLNDITNITQTYQELTGLNNQLIGEYNKRTNNQKQLLETLKNVNQIIQLGSKLRVGKPQAEIVQACRKAIKTMNISSLFHALTSS